MDARGERTWCGQCGAVELWPENVPSALLFLACDTQWRYAGMNGVPTGLDYDGVRAVMELQAIPPNDRPGLFADIQTLEQAQLKIVHDRIKQASPPVQPAPSRR
jgi:hypothetical protein